MPSNTGQHPQLTIMAMVTKLIQKNIENKKLKYKYEKFFKRKKLIK